MSGPIVAALIKDIDIGNAHSRNAKSPQRLDYLWDRILALSIQKKRVRNASGVVGRQQSLVDFLIEGAVRITLTDDYVIIE